MKESGVSLGGVALVVIVVLLVVLVVRLRNR